MAAQELYDNVDSEIELMRANCEKAQASVVLDINNVRARLFSGGSLFGTLTLNPYVVPNPGTGEPGYGLFSGSALIVGGFDEYDNLRTSSVEGDLKISNSFWPGPIVEQGVGPDPDQCRDWDRFFEVRNEDIEIHRNNIAKYIEMGLEYPHDEISDRIKYWPGAGNPFFSEKYDFDLPNHVYGLAPFYDYEGNGIYNPAEGDFPVLEAGACSAEFQSRVPDQMYFWIFNDAGFNPPNPSNLFLEFRVMGFAFESDKELAEMTFYNYEIYNRGHHHIDSLYFAKIKSPKLGCPYSHLIGSNPGLDMMFVYEERSNSPESPDDCYCISASGPIPNYCEHIPAVGMSYLSGLSGANGEDKGMSVFTYYRMPLSDEEPGTSPPNSPREIYNVISGSWRDGLPITHGGSGYSTAGGTEVSHVFSDPPDDPDGWSHCNEDLESFWNLTTVMSTGPVSLRPGGSNKVTMAVTWVPDLDYPCPDLSRLFSSNKRARTLFNACFETEMRGPDAPNLVVSEADKRIDFTIENSWPESNNANEDYREKGTFLPDGIADDEYVFEGYKVYQLRNQHVEPSPENLRNPHLARLVYQTDVENGIGDIYNWEPSENPNPLGRRIFRPALMVEGTDAGIERNFALENDAFSEGGAGEFEVGRTYYYTAIAYAYNNYEQFNWREPEVGQRTQYIASSRNVKVYSVNISSSLESDDPEVEEEIAGDIDESPSTFDKKNQLSLQIYGNPVQNHLRFEINGAGKSAVHLRLISTHGQEVYSGKYGSGMHSISTSNLPSGLYFMEVFDPESQERVVENWVRQ